MLGISLYAGLDLNLEENIDYLNQAHKLGINNIFFSLHIPEVNKNFLKEAKILFKEMNKLNFNITADISKKYYEKLDLSQFNLNALRLDFGFKSKEIAILTKNNDFKININASTITEKNLEEIIKHGGKLANIEAFHNYYPRPETGISKSLLLKKNNIFKKYDIEIAAFIPANYKKRPPIKAGLPTLEKHRKLSPIITGQDLLKSGVDKVYIGDSRASLEELKDFSLIRKYDNIIPIKILTKLSREEKRLINLEHINRQDPGEYMIRSKTARKNKIEKIETNNTIKRFKYSLTIDNYKYKRYEGDLQLLKKDYPANKKINVLADAGEAALIIEKIKEGETFKFLIKGDESSICQ
ncbi:MULTISPECIES: MupG family TIM beta-alpha barrel fold protein [unclassified Halanaerobium]|uniref:MupG family TIM beta-alpha barrel fold protein n=1 Tax=unclassified Halanaerobium TaxID=2641197 RepID=UPI000DF47437|nr:MULTISPECIES: MupG family TIM beta-alpha barrel fold protein [unclassified Halanaerobium]RCW41369.1 hypothetical protein DFR78_13410 [Halanaerobium sp. MA284_MarDTE_T2]RCW86950.1 hypothetical protein DER71_10658 [Halanaerobium sp. DL-01]